MPAAPGERVLFVVDALHLNGAVRITVDLARRWSGGGAALVALKAVQAAERIDVPDEVGLHVVSRAPTLGVLSAGIALIRVVGLARRSAAVVVGSEIGVGVAFGYLAARVARRPFLIAIHADLDDALEEWMSPRWIRVLRWVHRRADGVIAVEDALVEPVVRNGLPRSRVAVVRNGVDVDATRRAAAAAPGPLDGIVGPQVVATGRLAHQKATDSLIRAHAAVVRDVPHHVLLLNDGPDGGMLLALAAELGVSDTVHFEGRVPPHPVVARADLFCLPSRHEGLPLSLLEAMAVGTPVLATDSSAGVRDALEDGAAGGLIPVDDLVALTAALRAHLLDPEPLRRKAVRATERLSEFDIDAMASGWAAAVRAVVRRDPPQAPK